MDNGPKELSTEQLIYVYSKVRRLEDILTEVPLAKDRVEKIRRLGTFSDRLYLSIMSSNWRHNKLLEMMIQMKLLLQTYFYIR